MKNVWPLAMPKAYILRFSNKNMQAHFCLKTLAVFHVKHPIASVATGSLLTGITEHEDVGLWCNHSPNM